MNEEEFNDKNKSNIADKLDTAANLYNGYQNYKNNKKDVAALNNRAKNEPTNNNVKNEESEESVKKSTSLEENERLNKNEGLNKKNNIKTKNESNNKSSKDKNKGSLDLLGSNGIKNKFLSLKRKVQIMIILSGIIIAISLLLLFFILMIMIIDNFTSSISTFFGVSEGNVVKDDVEYDYSGLYTDKDYYFDEDGNELSSEDLVNKLKEDNQCKITIWNTITDWFSGNEMNNACELLRHIERQSTDNTDRGLIIGTIFYGYDAQPNKNDYINKEDYNDDIPASNHFEALNDLLQNTKGEFLDKGDIEDLIDQSEIESKYTYYTWNIDSSEEGKLIGKCESHNVTGSKFSLLRWQIFMRFGEDVSNEYAQAVQENEKNNLFDEECTGKLSNEELLNRVKSSATNNDIECSLDENSINNAVAAYSNSNNENLDIYEQAADIESKTKDIFEGDFDYKNGFAFKHFPYYSSMDKSNSSYQTNLEYDEVFTPKEIETIIQEIVDRKSDLNSVLLFDDKEDDTLSYDDTLSSVVTGAYCGNYLKAQLDDITVRLTDCNGLFMANVPFSEYIVGVANGEVSDSNDNYVLSEMVAAISYALNRRGNYNKGTVIDMRSGTCDQVYCSIEYGCTSRAEPQVCSKCSSYLIGGDRGKGTAERHAKYMTLYEKAKDYLLVKDGKVFGVHYVSTIQNQWYNKASKGMSFTQIIQETYKDEGAELIKCSDINNESDDENDNLSIPSSGTTATAEYPKTSPNVGKFPGFSYNDGPEGREIEINPDWKKANLTSINSNCSEAGWSKSYTINTNAKSNFEKAFSSICNILKNGVEISNGETCKYTANDLANGGTFVERTQTNGNFSLHAYGLAQDWNYTKKYNINGVEYNPYGSNRSIQEYQRFVDALGGEENCENINYILYKYAYKDAGFNWGGNWTGANFDGMHFELKY